MGWDIGGANLKAVRVDRGGAPRWLERPFEVWREPAGLARALLEMGRELGIAGVPGAPMRHRCSHAVTMTAELADCFGTKREGVRAVLAGLAQAFPGADLRVFSVRGTFVPPSAAAARPLEAAGANWRASAGWLARDLERAPGAAILLDVGSTTTDLVPLAHGRVRARGRTDPERLVEGELVYTGAQRTPLCAILRTAPFRGRECPVAAEHFAIAADAHVWLGDLAEEEYRCATPDGGPATRRAAGARLARVVCADLEMLTEDELTAIARRAAEAQIQAVAAAISRVAGRLAARRRRSAAERRPARGRRPPATRGHAAADPTAVRVLVAGSGAWLGIEAARRSSLPAERLAASLGDLARVLPAYAAARLLESALEGAAASGRRRRTGKGAGRPARAPTQATV